MIVTDTLVAGFVYDFQHVQVRKLEPTRTNHVERGYVHVASHEVVKVTDQHAVGNDYAAENAVVPFQLPTEAVQDFQRTVDHVGIGNVDASIELRFVDFPELSATQSSAVEFTEQVVFDDLHVLHVAE